MPLKDELPEHQECYGLYGQPVPSVLVVVDECVAPLSRWHAENEERHPRHYSGIARYVNPDLYISPPCVLKLAGREAFCRYLVTSKRYLERELINWSRYLLPAYLSRPTLLLSNGSPKFGVQASARAQKVNLLNHLRLGFLLAPRTTSLSELLGHASNNRRVFHNAADLLLTLHQYHGPLARFNKAWNAVRQCSDTDAQIMVGRYQPTQFGDARSGVGERLGEGNMQAFLDQTKKEEFKWAFEKEADQALLDEIVAKTAGRPVEELLEGVYNRQMFGGPVQLSAEVREALKLLAEKRFNLSHSFSNAAHCAMFNQLPQSVQAMAVQSSAKTRLNKILNPFSLLDTAREGEVLGGPLPWESRCVAKAAGALQRKVALTETLGSVVASGPLRAGLRGVYNWMGRSLLV